ncbi:hypothetical protein [Mucilaginibacter antarcticus]|uniref:Uncharacterized protein n=1 Tax=Mucilaginibacter antarcticus TaxID=1855725 RepID=A0ABW5XPF3_9SPHI
MIESKDTKPAEKDGRYRFEIHYSGRDVTCVVEKEQKMLHVTIDDNLNAELKINNDDSISQIDGAQLPESCIEYIKKQVLQ